MPTYSITYSATELIVADDEEAAKEILQEDLFDIVGSKIQIESIEEIK